MTLKKSSARAKKFFVVKLNELEAYPRANLAFGFAKLKKWDGKMAVKFHTPHGDFTISAKKLNRAIPIGNTLIIYHDEVTAVKGVS